MWMTYTQESKVLGEELCVFGATKMHARELLKREHAAAKANTGSRESWKKVLPHVLLIKVIPGTVVAPWVHRRVHEYRDEDGTVVLCEHCRDYPEEEEWGDIVCGAADDGQVFASSKPCEQCGCEGSAP